MTSMKPYFPDVSVSFVPSGQTFKQSTHSEVSLGEALHSNRFGCLSCLIAAAALIIGIDCGAWITANTQTLSCLYFSGCCLLGPPGVLMELKPGLQQSNLPSHLISQLPPLLSPAFLLCWLLFLRCGIPSGFSFSVNQSLISSHPRLVGVSLPATPQSCHQ